MAHSTHSEHTSRLFLVLIFIICGSRLMETPTVKLNIVQCHTPLSWFMGVNPEEPLLSGSGIPRVAPPFLFGADLSATGHGGEAPASLLLTGRS